MKINNAILQRWIFVQRVLQESVEFNDNSTRGMEITFKACKLTGMVNLKPTMYRAATANLSQARSNILPKIFFDRLFLIRTYWNPKSGQGPNLANLACRGGPDVSIRISDCEKNYQQRHLAGVNFWFTESRKILLIIMTFIPECQLGLWKLLSRLLNWQVWSIWNLLCIRISDCEKNYQQRHLAGVNFVLQSAARTCWFWWRFYQNVD